MPATVFPPSIRSRPVYGTLRARRGSAHLLVADGLGAEAILDCAAEAPDLMAAAHVIYCPGPEGADLFDRLLALRPASHHRSPSFGAALPRLRKVLGDARMGTQVYLAGTESLIGQAMREALDAGLPLDAIQTEHRGPTVRRVQCVHCKGVTEEVRTDPFRCAHCGLWLFVRDHYSRRLAAFQGVNIDAEDPGRVPAPAARFT